MYPPERGIEPGGPRGYKPDMEQELEQMEQQIRDAILEVRHRMACLDAMAKEAQARLEVLRRQARTPDVQRQISSLEQKLTAYRSVRSAVETSEQLQRSPELFKQTGSLSIKDALSLKLSQAEVTVAQGRMQVEEMAASIRLLEACMALEGVRPEPALGTVDAARALQLKVRATEARFAEHARRILDLHKDMAASLRHAEQQLAKARKLEGMEAYEFLLNEVPIPLLARQLHYLRQLPGTFEGDPDLLGLFPPPQEVRYPERPRSNKRRPVTDRLRLWLGR